MKIKITAAIAAAMLSFALTVKAQTTLNVPGGTVGTSTTANVGIGTTTPAGQFHIEAPNIPGTQEILLKATAADAPNDFLTIQNATGGNGYFIPNIWGHYTGTLNRGLFFTGSTNSTNDVVSTFPLISIDGRQFNSGVHSAIVNRPIFQVSNLLTPLMTVNANGNLGIGTNTPGALLDVKSSGNNLLSRFSTTSPGNSWINIGNANVGLNIGIGSTNVAGYIWSSNSKVFIGNDGDPTLFVNWAGQKNVGIGTATPSGKLELFVPNSLECFNLNQGTNGKVMFFGPNLGTGSYNHITTANDAGIIYAGPTGNTNTGFVIAPWRSSLSGIRLDNNGRVFIGTTSLPTTDNSGQYQLMVKDGIITEKVKVALVGSSNWSWPDFVFNKSYTLRPLSEVESFINKNHHLPEIPSEEEVRKDGIDLAEMDAKLLQKIEELTLYMIEMKKENDALKKDIETLKSK
jgi:hypothetical protein